MSLARGLYDLVVTDAVARTLADDGGRWLRWLRSDLDAVTRELHEELAVDVVQIGEALFAVADPGSPYEIVFVPTTTAGEPRCEEHVALAWLSLDEMAAVPLAPGDRRFVEFMLERPMRSRSCAVCRPGT